MKIISKFRDYYDSVLAYGHDEDRVYVRDRSAEGVNLKGFGFPWEATTSETRRYGVGAATAFVFTAKSAEDAMPRLPREFFSIDRNSKALRLEEAFVVVAGKAHPVWLRYDTLSALVGEVDVGMVGSPDLEGWAGFWKKKREDEEALYGRSVSLHVVAEVKERAKDKAATYQAARGRFLEQDFSALHLEQEAPVLLLASLDSFFTSNRGVAVAPQANTMVVRNPKLLDLGMQKFLDPVAAFQSISQFIDGVVPGRQLPMVEISDKSQVVKKGFDPKYGFRTRPTR